MKVNPFDEGLEELSRHVDAAVTLGHRRRSERATALALGCLNTNAERVDGLKRRLEGVEGELSELLTKLPQAMEAAKVEAERLAEDEAESEGDGETLRKTILARTAEPLREMKAQFDFLLGEKNVIDGELMVLAEEQARLEAVPGVLEALKARRDEAEREAEVQAGLQNLKEHGIGGFHHKSSRTLAQETREVPRGRAPPPLRPPPTKKQTSPPQAKVAVGPRSVRAAVDAAHLAFPETLVFTKSALDSADASSYPHTQRVESAFGALDTVCKNRRAANGGGIGPLEEAFGALGCEYSAHQSEDTLNRWGEEYVMTYKGGSLSIQQNLKLGNDRDCLRIYFGWDATELRFVVAHCGAHKTTSQT